MLPLRANNRTLSCADKPTGNESRNDPVFVWLPDTTRPRGDLGQVYPVIGKEEVKAKSSVVSFSDPVSNRVPGAESIAPHQIWTDMSREVLPHPNMDLSQRPLGLTVADLRDWSQVWPDI